MLFNFFDFRFSSKLSLLSRRKSLELFRHANAAICFNRAYPENTNVETFVPRNLKFHTFGDLYVTKKC